MAAVEGGDWTKPAIGLSRAALDALLRREIPAIHVAGFATADECGQLVAELHRCAGRDAETSPMRLVGSNFSNHHGASKSEYFNTVADSQQNLSRLTDASFDPVQRLLERLRGCWSGTVGIADEGEPFGRYFAGCVKTRVAGSAMHYDFVPDMVDGYEIARVRAQLSWNLYLEMPDATGETTVFDKLVDARHDLTARGPGAKVRWDNLVDPRAVKGRAAYKFKGIPGELVLFNTRCPHRVTVEQIEEHERRTQIGGFAGLTAQRDFIIWS